MWAVSPGYEYGWWMLKIPEVSCKEQVNYGQYPEQIPTFCPNYIANLYLVSTAKYCHCTWREAFNMQFTENRVKMMMMILLSHFDQSCGLYERNYIFLSRILSTIPLWLRESNTIYKNILHKYQTSPFELSPLWISNVQYT